MPARLALLAITLALTAANPSRADLITTAAGVPGAATVIDFSQFSGPFVRTNGPLDLGAGVTFTSTSPNLAVVGDGAGTNQQYGFSNGQGVTWDAGRVGFVGLNFGSGDLLFRFDTPVRVAGGLVNWDTHFGPVVLSALAADGSVLESYDLRAVAPITRPGGLNYGEFRGIARADADIAALRLSNGYAVLDDLTFSAAPVAVPEPATFILMATGVGGVVLIRRRRAC
ncbi:MAG: PEP-CTERM sorting domain-containing protein [Gemmataceae bacterium]|nr:PEP-CTERM sorting domain-containing protein [Gemmataceae bacterium]